MSKLNWSVEKDAKGKFIRRRAEGDLLNLDYIDVKWTHEDSFPNDTKLMPQGHPPDITYEETDDGQRDVIHDQLIVAAAVQDSTVSMMLDEKRPKLAAALGIEE